MEILHKVNTNNSKIAVPEFIVVFDGTSAFVTSGLDFDAMHENEVIFATNDEDEADEFTEVYNSTNI